MVAYNNGNAQFTVTRNRTPLGLDTTFDIISDDFNLDGKVDFVLSSSAYTRRRIVSFLQKTNGDFEEYLVAEPLVLSESLAIGDLNGDSLKDIICVSEMGNKVVWLKGEGDNSFSEAQIISNKQYPNKSVHVQIIDFDKDGEIDLLLNDYYRKSISWFKNIGDEQFEEVIFVTDIPYITYVEAVDIDQNNEYELLVSTIHGDVYLFEESDGTYSQKEKLISREINQHLNIRFDRSIFQIVDLNNDSFLDIASGSSLSRDFRILMNDKRGGFNETIIDFDILNSLGMGYFQIIDWNKDSYKDIVFTFYDNNLKGTFYIENLKDGTFSELQLITPEVLNPISFVSDVDGDNDYDLVNGKGRYWLENDGFNVFSIVDNSEDIFYPVSLFDDIDLDGDKDLVYVDWPFLQRIFWSENLSGLPTIQGKVFWDENENGVFDAHEKTIENASLEITPSVLTTHTNKKGEFKFYVSDGTYYLNIHTDSCWELTTDSSAYEVKVEGEIVTNNDFGFRVVSNYQYQHTQPRINSGFTRCGFEVPIWLSVENDFCVPSEGQFGLVLSDLVEVVSTARTPDEVRGDTLLWNYPILVGSAVEKTSLMLRVAGTDFIGDTIKMTGLSYIKNENGELELSDTYDYTSEIRCAYDPNDKLVFPNRSADYDKNYTLFDEELEYTIRFQNTGNDTTFTVVIRDYLDNHLDWTTFQPILASQPYETKLNKDGLIEFKFKNILLPDSTTNEPLSHGFVTYRIQPEVGLAESTVIENTASIFFDFNPPIVTNTTNNMLVSELPKITSTENLQALEQVQVFPNPFSGNITFVWENPQAQYDIQVFDMQGKIIQTIQNRMSGIAMDTEQLSSGLYFYKVFDSSGAVVNYGKLVKQ